MDVCRAFGAIQQGARVLAEDPVRRSPRQVSGAEFHCRYAQGGRQLLGFHRGDRCLQGLAAVSTCSAVEMWGDLIVPFGKQAVKAVRVLFFQPRSKSKILFRPLQSQFVDQFKIDLVFLIQARSFCGKIKRPALVGRVSMNSGILEDVSRPSWWYSDGRPADSWVRRPRPCRRASHL